jgi:uncharacterized SAM-binding protein YcdF (DUF218 family)
VSSFLAASSTAVLGLGLPIAWRLRQVLAIARRDDREPADLILVLGRTLVDDRPAPVFVARLAHAAELYRLGRAPRIVVAGGLTGRATRTEAEAGRDWLVEQGVPTADVICEDESRHTLENLVNTRQTLRREGWSRLIVVTDPLHLARAAAFARGLGLSFQLSPALAAPPRRGSLGWYSRALREATLLHWYHAGVFYSRAIRSERMLSRVT